MVLSARNSCVHHSMELEHVSCRPSSASAGTRTPTTRASSPMSLCSLSLMSESMESPMLSRLGNSSNELARRHALDKGFLDSSPLLADVSRPRPLSQFVADVAKGISEVSLSKSSGHKCHMAGAPSRAVLQQRRSSPALERSQSSPALDSQCSDRAKSTGTQNTQRRRRSNDKRPQAPTLKHVFGSFALGREQMYWRDFERLCSCSLLFDAQFMVPDARRLFDCLLVDGQRSIELGQFDQLLSDVAFQRQCTVELVHRLVKASMRHRTY